MYFEFDQPIIWRSRWSTNFPWGARQRTKRKAQLPYLYWMHRALCFHGIGPCTCANGSWRLCDANLTVLVHRDESCTNSEALKTAPLPQPTTRKWNFDGHSTTLFCCELQRSKTNICSAKHSHQKLKKLITSQNTRSPKNACTVWKAITVLTVKDTGELKRSYEAQENRIYEMWTVGIAQRTFLNYYVLQWLIVLCLDTCHNSSIKWSNRLICASLIL